MFAENFDPLLDKLDLKQGNMKSMLPPSKRKMKCRTRLQGRRQSPDNPAAEPGPPGRRPPARVEVAAARRVGRDEVEKPIPYAGRTVVMQRRHAPAKSQAELGPPGRRPGGQCRGSSSTS